MNLELILLEDGRVDIWLVMLIETWKTQTQDWEGFSKVSLNIISVKGKANDVETNLEGISPEQPLTNGD